MRHSQRLADSVTETGQTPLRVDTYKNDAKHIKASGTVVDVSFVKVNHGCALVNLLHLFRTCLISSSHLLATGTSPTSVGDIFNT